MRLLLDTHVALWALTDDKNLGKRAREYLLDPSNEVFFSAASIWKIAIKHALARKDVPVSAADAFRFLIEAGYAELPVLSAHAATVEALPKHHADPFDRILVAQAVHEPMKLITRDRHLLAYGEIVEFV